MLASACLLAISAYLGVEAGLSPALTMLISIGYLSQAFLFKGLFLFGPYRALHGEAFSGSYLLIAIMLAAFWLPFMIAGLAIASDQIHETPPGWFWAFSTLVVVLFCWIWIRLRNIKRSPY
jgi:hypothetical protein